MKIEMLQARTINGKIIKAGEEVELDESRAAFLVARKEAKRVVEKPAETVAETSPVKAPETPLESVKKSND